MFTFLINWLATAISYIVAWAIEVALTVWREIRLYTWYIYLFVSAFIYFAIKGITFLIDMTKELILMIAQMGDSVSGYSHAGCPGDYGIGTILAITNTFAPLDEAIAIVVDLIALWLLIGLYNLIKSYLPAGFAGGAK